MKTNHPPRLEEGIEIKGAMDRVGDVTGNVRRPTLGGPDLERPRIDEDATVVDLRVRDASTYRHSEGHIKDARRSRDVRAQAHDAGLPRRRVEGEGSHPAMRPGARPGSKTPYCWAARR
jgi:hypothetical protein